MRSTPFVPVLLTAIGALPAAHPHATLPAPAGGPPACDATPITSMPVTITQPGRYCVTQNFVVDAGTAIFVQTGGGVEIDFNGHLVRGIVDALNCVEAVSGNVTVRNGTIGEFGANALALGNHSRVYDMRVAGSGGAGATLGADGIVERSSFVGTELGVRLNARGLMKDCQVLDTVQAEGVRALRGSRLESVIVEGGGVGIRATTDSLLVDCVVRDFTVEGIVLEEGSSARGCTATTSESNAIAAIQVGPGGRVSDCSASGAEIGFLLAEQTLLVDSNAVACGTGILATGSYARIRGCLVTGSTGDGIAAAQAGVEVEGTTVAQSGGNGISLTGPGSAVRACSVQENGADGIRLAGGSVAWGNTCRANVGAGLCSTGPGNRIQDNVLDGNGVGLTVATGNNLVIGNRAFGNTGADFEVAYPNAVGRILAVPYWIPTSNPQANFGSSPF